VLGLAKLWVVTPGTHAALKAWRAALLTYQIVPGSLQYFASSGSLISSFHSTYWLGLYILNSDPRVWPSFMWLDGSPKPSTYQQPKLAYGHWGTQLLGPGEDREEPNNLVPPEFCAVANASQAFGNAWGWSDTNCDELHFSMCKLPGESAMRRPAGACTHWQACRDWVPVSVWLHSAERPPRSPAAPPPPASPSSPPSPPPPAPPRQTSFTSRLTRSTYTFNPNRLIFNAAADVCARAGGYLVYYPSLAVQQEVEAFFTRQGFISSSSFYWIGARVSFLDVWPTFTWLTGKALDNSSYLHWGVYYKPGSHPEPNNIFPPEDCAGANGTAAWGGAFGWTDVRCTLTAPFICEVPPPGPPPPSPAPPADVYVYKDETGAGPTGGVTYLYSTDAMDFLGSLEFCQTQGEGASLVGWRSLEEQRAVEAALIDQGAIPYEYWPYYWIGLRMRDVWPNFAWVVPTSKRRCPLALRRVQCACRAVPCRAGCLAFTCCSLMAALIARVRPARADSTYMHWGSQEPNRATGPEECAVANVTQTYMGAWGWSDAPCAMLAPFMCSIRESPAWLDVPSPLPAALSQ
jgi:hypothetical protein